MTVSGAKTAVRRHRSARKLERPQDDFGVLVDSGVDWITATCSDAGDRSRFREFGVAMLQVQSWDNGKAQPWSFMGFEGLKADGIAFGEQDKMSIVRLSGPAAWDHWSRAFELSTNCSRFDVQATVRMSGNVEAIIRAHHKEAMDHVAGWPKPPEILLRDSNVNGPTLYLNQRTSARFVRLYDKHRESKLAHYENCLRSEVQFNGRHAQHMATYFYGLKGHERDYAGGVSRYLEKKGLRPRWSSSSHSLPSRPRKRSDAARRLSWLSVQVRPCIESLLALGLRSQVLEALGLAHLLRDD